ncbi:hypothetical protein HAX54_051117, partial [Datura stramonium]|nr:hypothetical protein [Datura stramonium]
ALVPQLNDFTIVRVSVTFEALAFCRCPSASRNCFSNRGNFVPELVAFAYTLCRSQPALGRFTLAYFQCVKGA